MNRGEISAWDKYTLNLPGSTSSKASKSTLSHVNKYENSRFLDSINQKNAQSKQEEDFDTLKTGEETKTKIEFEMLKEKKLLQVSSKEEGEEGQAVLFEMKNYLRPSDSLRQR